MTTDNESPFESVVSVIMDRMKEVQGAHERALLQNIKLLDYITDFHNEMNALSERMQAKTEKLFTELMDIERLREEGVADE